MGTIVNLVMVPYSRKVHIMKNNRLTTLPDGRIQWHFDTPFVVSHQPYKTDGMNMHLLMFNDLYEMYETLCTVTDNMDYYLDGVQIIKDYKPVNRNHRKYYTGTRKRPCSCGKGYYTVRWDHSEWYLIGPTLDITMHCKVCEQNNGEEE